MQLATGGAILGAPESYMEAAIPMHESTQTGFDPAAFLAMAGLGRRIIEIKAKQVFFAQGVGRLIFYLQRGRADLTVVSKRQRSNHYFPLCRRFYWEESIAAVPGCDSPPPLPLSAKALKITREMIRVMREQHAFSNLFLKFLLARSMRTQADLVDQLFNSSEKRLARILLLMAEFGKPGEPETLTL